MLDSIERTSSAQVPPFFVTEAALRPTQQPSHFDYESRHFFSTLWRPQLLADVFCVSKQGPLTYDTSMKRMMVVFLQKSGSERVHMVVFEQ